MFINIFLFLFDFLTFFLPGIPAVSYTHLHVANSVNTFSCEEWDATFGKIYANLIDNGLEAIMAGHIMLPSYTRAMNPDIKDDDIMPATLSKELLTDLLKGKMGFNGMVLTDCLLYTSRCV